MNDLQKIMQGEKIVPHICVVTLCCLSCTKCCCAAGSSHIALLDVFQAVFRPLVLTKGEILSTRKTAACARKNYEGTHDRE